MYEHIDVIWLVLSYYITLRWVVDLVTYRVTLMSNIRICSYFALVPVFHTYYGRGVTRNCQYCVT